MARFKIIFLEVVNSCNFRCVFCPQSKLSRKRATMSLPDAQNIISQIHKYDLTGTLTYHLMGEPLLNKDLGQIMAYAKGLGFRNILNTNGSLLDKEKQPEVWDSADAILISVRGNAETFQRNITGAMDYLAYVERIRAIIEGADGKKVVLRLFNKDDAAPLSDLAGRFEPRIDRKFDFFRSGNGNRTYPAYLGKCDGLQRQLAILVNGDVSTCCFDYEGRNSLGNALTGDLMEILESERARAFKKRLSRGILPTKTCRECFGASDLLTYSLRQIYGAGQVLGLLPPKSFF